VDLEPRTDLPDFRGPLLLPPGTPLTVVKAWRDGTPRHAAGHSHLILSGSTCSITEENPTTEPSIALVWDALRRGVPVLGICYGHQLIVRALLGRDHVRRATAPEFGWLPIHWDEPGRPWFDGLPNPFRVFVGHFDEVCDLPEGWNVLARSAGCRVHAFECPVLRVVGFQFHPEFDLASGNACFALDRSALAAAGADVPALLRDAREDGSGRLLFPRFLARRWP
jgi:GMP synthase (glutamine-hydrolysing)